MLFSINHHLIKLKRISKKNYRSSRSYGWGNYLLSHWDLIFYFLISFDGEWIKHWFANMKKKNWSFIIKIFNIFSLSPLLTFDMRIQFLMHSYINNKHLNKLYFFEHENIKTWLLFVVTLQFFLSFTSLFLFIII